MADPPRSPDTGGDTGVGPDRGEGMPRWVKVLGIIVAVVVLLIVIVMLLPGGGHGPSRHGAGDEPAGQIEQVAAGDHAVPEGGRG